MSLADILAISLSGGLRLSHWLGQAADRGRSILGRPRPKLETLDDVIADFFQKLTRLSAIVDQAQDLDDFLKAFAVYSRSLVHLSRLLRDKQSLAAAPPAGGNDLFDLLGRAVEEVKKELGVDLIP